MTATPYYTDCMHCGKTIQRKGNDWTHLDGEDKCEGSYAAEGARWAEPSREDKLAWKLQMNSTVPTVDNTVDKRVDVLITIQGVGHSVFTSVPLSVVNEAIAHINDNA